jgi:hypothetical protein
MKCLVFFRWNSEDCVHLCQSAEKKSFQPSAVSDQLFGFMGTVQRCADA